MHRPQLHLAQHCAAEQALRQELVACLPFHEAARLIQNTELSLKNIKFLLSEKTKNAQNILMKMCVTIYL